MTNTIVKLMLWLLGLIDDRPHSGKENVYSRPPSSD